MDALADNPVSLLLIGLITTVALVDAIRRRKREGPSLWWRPVARAFAGAGVFVALGLWYTNLWYRHGLWRWFPPLPMDEPGTNYINGTLAGLVLADIVMIGLMY